MVRQSKRDVEANVDLQILSQHYSGKSGLLKNYTPTIGRASRSRPIPTTVVNLADLREARQEVERKRGLVKRIWGILRRKSKPVQETRTDVETKSYVIENYQRDVLSTLRSEGINPIVGAAGESLIDESDNDSSSQETELERINQDDDESMSQEPSASPPVVQLEQEIAEDSREYVSVTTAGAKTISDADPWTFFTWFFGCSDELHQPTGSSKAKSGRGNQTQRHHMLDDNRDDIPVTDDESLETDYSQDYSDAENSSYPVDQRSI